MWKVITALKHWLYNGKKNNEQNDFNHSLDTPASHSICVRIGTGINKSLTIVNEWISVSVWTNVSSRKSIHMLIKTLFGSSGGASRRCFASLIVHHQLNSITCQVPSATHLLWSYSPWFFIQFFLSPANACCSAAAAAVVGINISIPTNCLRHNKSIIQGRFPPPLIQHAKKALQSFFFKYSFGETSHTSLIWKKNIWKMTAPND